MTWGLWFSSLYPNLWRPFWSLIQKPVLADGVISSLGYMWKFIWCWVWFVGFWYRFRQHGWGFSVRGWVSKGADEDQEGKAYLHALRMSVMFAFATLYSIVLITSFASLVYYLAPFCQSSYEVNFKYPFLDWAPLTFPFDKTHLCI